MCRNSADWFLNRRFHYKGKAVTLKVLQILQKQSYSQFLQIVSKSSPWPWTLHFHQGYPVYLGCTLSLEKELLATWDYANRWVRDCGLIRDPDLKCLEWQVDSVLVGYCTKSRHQQGWSRLGPYVGPHLLPQGTGWKGVGKGAHSSK